MKKRLQFPVADIGSTEPSLARSSVPWYTHTIFSADIGGKQMTKLPRDFYAGSTVQIAQNLLGKVLVRDLDGELLAGRITETEAYVGRCDKACHAYGGLRTARTETMFGPPGHAYVYLIYGMYHCLNLVTEPEGEAAAVLIRAVEPVLGIPKIQKLRFGDKPMTRARQKSFMNGPGKLCKGLSIHRDLDGADLLGSELFLCDSIADLGIARSEHPLEHICCGPRIGIDYAEEAREFPWRFWLEPEV